jgi:hypothetical protein
MSLTDEQLRERLGAATEVDVDVDGDFSFVRTRARQRRRRGRIVGATVALVVGIAFAGVVAVVARAGNEHSSILSRPGPSATTATLLPPGTERVPRSAITSYPAPEGSGATLALGDGSVWVGGSPSDLGACHVDCGRITRINAKTGEVMATITVPKLPRALVFEYGALWVEVEWPDNSPALVLKINPATNAIEAQTELVGTSIVGSTGHPRLAAGAGYVWSLYGNRLDKIDRTTGALLATTTLPFWGDHIVANGQGVWIVEGSPGIAVVAINAGTLEGTEIAALPAGYVQSATINRGVLWLTESHGTVTIELIEVDPGTGDVTFTGIPTANVASGAGELWFQGFVGPAPPDPRPGAVVELDPTRKRPKRVASVGLGSSSSPSLAVDGNAVWILSGGGLVRIRP